MFFCLNLGVHYKTKTRLGQVPDSYFHRHPQMLAVDVAGSLYLLLLIRYICPFAGWLGGISYCFDEGTHYLYLSMRCCTEAVRQSVVSRCLFCAFLQFCSFIICINRQLEVCRQPVQQDKQQPLGAKFSLSGKSCLF